MDDLTKYLYEFLMEQRMRDLWQNEEYKACISSRKLQEERLEASLTEEQREELQILLERITAESSVENRYLFQVTLALAQELNALVR